MQQRFYPLVIAALLIFLGQLLLTGCDRQPDPSSPVPVIPATVVTIDPQDVPIDYEFVGQAASSRKVEIRARVDGFLEKQAYLDGALVKSGQILFELDKKPFQADLQQAQGELALHQARHTTAMANLSRIKPLAEKDAVSQKDLDDAIGREKETLAAVLAAEGAVRQTELNLSYATIRTPVTGLASKADKQEGSYIPTGPDSLLTYVAQLNPIWVNFSVSENQILRARQQQESGQIRPPSGNHFTVEVVLADQSVHPHTGYVNFYEPSVDPETGTMLIRAELANPEGSMRPGQFVRVRLKGAVRPNAVLLPQTAVMQGAKGFFVWVLDKDNAAQTRAVEVGPWHDDDWFIEKGLQVGDRVVVDNLIKLSQGIQVQEAQANTEQQPANDQTTADNTE